MVGQVEFVNRSTREGTFNKILAIVPWHELSNTAILGLHIIAPTLKSVEHHVIALSVFDLASPMLVHLDALADLGEEEVVLRFPTVELDLVHETKSGDPFGNRVRCSIEWQGRDNVR